ncbi:MAG: hypothetical protein ACO262_05755, partial [Vulcanococcus sp.]
MAERGCFLVLEGIDGCGKTTQLERLRACSTTKPSDAAACAQSFYLSGDLLDAMDLRIVNGQCVKGALKA